MDIYEITEEIIVRMSQSACKKNVTMSLDGESTFVKGIPSLCDEIIFNLCENAVKYNKEGGTVRVSVRQEDTGAALIVEDTGIGIPFEYRNRVFERFFRADKSHCSNIKGTGLGLSIVKNAVAYLGGSVELDSKEGVGTRITVHFVN